MTTERSTERSTELLLIESLAGVFETLANAIRDCPVSYKPAFERGRETAYRHAASMLHNLATGNHLEGKEEKMKDYNRVALGVMKTFPTPFTVSCHFEKILTAIGVGNHTEADRHVREATDVEVRCLYLACQAVMVAIEAAKEPV